ncbi:MAG: hypothetical protein Fues2KO_42610 [Fuerstiella sp.]
MKLERTTTTACSSTVRMVLVVGLMGSLLVGCYAPMHSPGIEARKLPEQFRWPIRTSAAPLNYSHLVARTPTTYLLGPGDKLQLTAPDLIAQGHSEPILIQVLDHGEVHLPRLGALQVEGLSLADAQQAINATLAERGLLKNPNTVLTLVEKGTVNVLVLGAVKVPGVHALPRFENDVAHALAAAQGFSEEAGEVIEIHRRGDLQPSCSTIPSPYLGMPGSPPTFRPFPASGSAQTGSPEPVNIALAQPTAGHALTGIPVGGVIRLPARSSAPRPGGAELQAPSVRQPAPGEAFRSSQQNDPIGQDVFRGQSPIPIIDDCGEACDGDASPILRIPLRGDTSGIDPAAMVLNPGDVLVIPEKTDKVFYVVGPLSEQNRLRFSVGDKDRQIGNGLLLPDNREVDVVTAVAMAGYIDPIESPTTVTVHRVMPDRRPLLIKVDLIAARSHSEETVMIQPGDIIYLNPDPWWYSRRTMDRVIERALGTAVGRWLTN